MLLYRETFVWRRLSTKRAVRYACFEDVEDGLFRVQSADFYYLPYNNDAVRDHAKRFVEGVIQRPGRDWFNSLADAIRHFDEGFGGLDLGGLPIELPEGIAFTGSRVTAIEERTNAIVLNIQGVSLFDIESELEVRAADVRLRLAGPTSIVIDGEPAFELPMAGDYGELRAIEASGATLTMTIAWRTSRPSSDEVLRHYAIGCENVGMIEPPNW